MIAQEQPARSNSLTDATIWFTLPNHDHRLARLQLLMGDFLRHLDGCCYVHQAIGGTHQLAARASLRNSGGHRLLPDVLAEGECAMAPATTSTALGIARHSRDLHHDRRNAVRRLGPGLSGPQLEQRSHDSRATR